MASYHAPRAGVVARPNACVAIHTLYALSADIDGQTRTECRHDNRGRHYSHIQRLRFVLNKLHRPAAMGRQVVAFARQLTIRPGEKQIVGNQRVQRLDISGELSIPKLRFCGNDLCAHVTVS